MEEIPWMLRGAGIFTYMTGRLPTLSIWVLEQMDI